MTVRSDTQTNHSRATTAVEPEAVPEITPMYHTGHNIYPLFECDIYALQLVPSDIRRKQCLLQLFISVTLCLVLLGPVLLSLIPVCSEVRSQML